MTNIFIDIETIPTQPEDITKAEIAEAIKAPTAMKKQETIDAWHNGEGKYAGEKDAAIEDAYRKTALDGAKGQVFSIVISDGGEPKGMAAMGISEAELLTKMFAEIKFMAGRIQPFFVGHHVTFDLKFLFHRAVILGVNPDFHLNFSGQHGRHYFDNMQEWAGYRQFIKQDAICAALGIKQKGEIDGSKVWDYVKAGKGNEVLEYNYYDVDTVQKIYNRLNFMG